MECNFSSVDVHTQFAYNIIHSGILGLVLEIQDDGNLVTYDFFELSREGKKSVEQCSRKKDCNPGIQHSSCSNPNFYQSASKNVILHDDFSLVIKNFMSSNNHHMSIPNRQRKSNISISDDGNLPSKKRGPLVRSKGLMKLVPNSFRLKKRELSTSDDDFQDLPKIRENLVEKSKKLETRAKTNCKCCGAETLKSKIIIHIKRSKNGCKEHYGEELDAMILEKKKQIKVYKKNYTRKNEEKIRAYLKNYGKRNAAKIKQRKANNRAKCPDKTKEREAKYDVEHSEERKLKAAERRKKRKMFNHKIYENFKLHERYHSWTKLCLL